ncbi:peptidoglycan DD-metalloendopeptidase family protein [Streptomyces solincola]
MNDQHPHAGYLGDGAYAPATHETGGFSTSGFQNDGHQAGTTDGYPPPQGTFPTDPFGADAYATGTFTPGAFAADPLFAVDPLFGAYPEAGDHGGGFPAGGDASAYPAPTAGYDAGHTGHSGQYDATAWATGTGYPEFSEYTGQWDASAWADAGTQTMPTATVPTSASPPETPQAAPVYEATAQWDASTFDTGAYSTAAWHYSTAPTETFSVPEQYDYAAADGRPDLHPDLLPGFHQDVAAEHDHAEAGEVDEVGDAALMPEGPDAPEGQGGPQRRDGTDGHAPGGEAELTAVVPRPARRAPQGGRGRRRTPAKRSALLTVAVPSACVMGVAGIAAASISGLTGEAAQPKTDDKAVTAADKPAVQPVVANRQLDTQLAALSADARDFGDRASRTQERIDLQVRQEAERKKRAEEAARREALRPKFALPVALHQLSARYGQAGVNWMSLHTGIDFPVQYGTPVMAATDGTVRTQWNSAYGNMAIVTAADGTETWYCHLSSTKIRSGSVKAGDTIAYSGNSGNSTGPHLHFEVRPGGGSAIDPLPWLLSHGLDPTS